MLNVLLFVGSYLFGLAATFVWLPVFAFALYQAVYFFNPPIRWWGYMVPNLSYSFFTVVTMGIAMLVFWNKTKVNKILKAPQFIWMLFLMLLFIVASSYAALPYMHEPATINFVKLCIIMCIAYKLVCSDKDLNIILWGHIFGAWYISFMTHQVGRNVGGRVQGIGTVDSPDANGTAAAIAPAVVLVLYYFWVSTDKKVKAAMAVAGAFIANAIVLINSRGAFLAVAVSVAYFMFHLYFSKFQRKNQKRSVVVLAILGLCAAIYLVDDSFIERIGTIRTSEVSSERESGATRTAFWSAAWDMAKDYPLGAGVAGFELYSPLYIDENVYTGGRRNRAVHSTWFEALSELGYLGFIAIIALVLTCFYTCSKARNVLQTTGEVDNYFKVRAIEGALIAFLVSATFINRLRADVLYWCILYTACAYNIYVLKYHSKAPQQLKVRDKFTKAHTQALQENV